MKEYIKSFSRNDRKQNYIALWHNLKAVRASVHSSLFALPPITSLQAASSDTGNEEPSEAHSSSRPQNGLLRKLDVLSINIPF